MVREENNDSKFDGLTEIYHLARPVLPNFPIELIQKYFGYCPGTILDLGCATGLSTFILQEYGKREIGVEPNQEMLEEARNAFPNDPSSGKDHPRTPGWMGEVRTWSSVPSRFIG